MTPVGVEHCEMGQDSGATAFTRARSQERRADPYPVYRRMQDNPSSRTGRDLFVVTRWAAVNALLRDRRVANDLRRRSGQDLA